MKTFYSVRYKQPARCCCWLWAESPEQALRQAAAWVGMDTDPLTQTYTLTLEAVPLLVEG